MKKNSVVETKPIFPESEEAAKFVTGISGWVDRDGRFFGTDERLARYSGSTHKHCDCGAVISRNSYCKSCTRSREIEKYNQAERIEWDHETPLYSQRNDEYLFDIDDLTNLIDECEITDPEELELFICEPNNLSHIRNDHWDDEFPEGCELPSNVQAAVNALNKAIDESGVVSWYPGKFAAIVKLIEL